MSIDIQKTINIFSFNIKFKVFFIIAVSILGIALFFLFYLFLKKVLMKRKLKRKNIKVYNEKSFKSYTLVSKFINYFNKEELKLKLIHSGNPAGIVSTEIYLIYRIIFVIAGIALGIQLSNFNNILYSIFTIILCSLLGFLVTDFMLYKGKKKRIKSIKEQLPIFLISFDNYTKAGLLFEDIVDIMPELVKGELKKELIRFNISYSLSKDFEGSIKDFIQRLGFVESEEIEIKMRQCYYSGIYDDVLTNEKEMIEKKVINDIKKETQLYSLYLALAMSLTVVNIFILVVVPLLSVAGEGMKILKL